MADLLHFPPRAIGLSDVQKDRLAHMADLGSTPNLTTLSGFGDSRVIPGDEIYVVAEDADFVYRIPPPSFVADGVNSVKAINLPGTWMRRVASDFLVQAAWFVDPTNGNDANVGDSAGTALQTDGERQRRWGSRTKIVQATTVTYLGTPTDMVNFDVQLLAQVPLTIAGSFTVGASGTITAQTTLNRATQTPQDITAAGIGAAGDLGTLIELTNGANAGAYARIAKQTVLGAACRTSPFGKITVPWPGPTVYWANNGITAGVDTYRQITPLPLNIGYWKFEAGDNSSLQGASHAPYVLIDGVQLNGGGSSLAGLGTIETNTLVIYFKRHILSRLTLAGGGGFAIGGGGFDGLQTVCSGLNATAYGICAMGTTASALVSGRFIIGFDALFQNNQLQVSNRFRNGGISFFDKSGASAAMQVVPSGVVRGLTSGGEASDLIWGDANNVANTAIQVQSSAVIVYTNKPTINSGTGATHQSLIGGTNKDWAAVPFVEPTNNAAIVALA